MSELHIEEKIFFTKFDLKVSSYGGSTVFKTLELELMLMEDTDEAHKQCPLPNVDDLPKDMQIALLDWLKGGSSGY